MPPNGVGRWRTFSELTQTMPASTRLREAVGAADIAGPDIGGQAVADVVGDAQSIGLVGERNGGQHGAENLLLGDPHRVAAPVKSVGGRNCPPPVPPHRGAAAAPSRLPSFCERDIAQHLVDVAGMDQRPDLGLRIQRMADLDASRPALQRVA